MHFWNHGKGWIWEKASNWETTALAQVRHKDMGATVIEREKINITEAGSIAVNNWRKIKEDRNWRQL